MIDDQADAISVNILWDSRILYSIIIHNKASTELLCIHKRVDLFALKLKKI